MVQEYGKYFGLATGSFRGGCLTGSSHSGAELHGFLAYLVQCIVTGRPYTIYGYKGKQVRDNIHATDVVNAFYRFYQKPKSGEVYNIGGGRYSNVSIMEAIARIEERTGKKSKTIYKEQNRIGDHIWYITDLAKFMKHFPDWKITFDTERILDELIDNVHI
jgi:CDP-paratose 2-epimerase